MRIVPLDEGAAAEGAGEILIRGPQVTKGGRELSASLTGIQWITDGYTMVFAGLLLTGGALGDRLGNRRVFCTGVAVFTVSSAACALARDAPALVAPMMAAGFGTSFALTGTTTTVMAAAPPGCSGTASALFNTARQIGSAAGVALGGTLLATAADQGRCLCLSMAAGALAYLTAAALALRCVPRKS